MASIAISVSGEGVGTVGVTAEFSEQAGIEILQAHAVRFPAEIDPDAPTVDGDGHPLPPVYKLKTARWIVEKMFNEIIGNALGITAQHEKEVAAKAAAAAIVPKTVDVKIM